ncbi:MAG: D-glycerate dehydrogenase [Chloroflexota bacterium]|nr:D-glycerate dehydrogenase [Chloroflexota bacterium]
MSKTTVYITRRRVPDAISMLEDFCEVKVWEENYPPPKNTLIDHLQNCQGILAEADDSIDVDVLQASNSLKVVSNRAVGVDNIDIEVATKLGIAVGNTPGVLHETCADFTFGLILSCARRIAFADRKVQGKNWKIFDQMPYLGSDVHHATLGIVGFGSIGQTVAKRAAGFGMRVLYHSRTRKIQLEEDLGVEWVPRLDYLLAESDFVTLHVPLNTQTHHLLSDQQFKSMKRGSFLINTSRGKIVDSKSLKTAISSGILSGVALDVTDPEPLPFDDELLGMDNVLITPHISSASTATVNAMGIMAAHNVIAALSGQKMPSCLNPQVF